MSSDTQRKSFFDKEISVIVKNFCLFEKLRKINNFPAFAIAKTLLLLNSYGFMLLHTVIVYQKYLCDRKVSVKFWGEQSRLNLKYLLHKVSTKSQVKNA
ncbi:hypothetical protein [Tychonema sp. BBK16]|uniref:hypothetical protein n=1 Tax=Tychonema sp. BBK16 TaxID=2699888 RepID=UPI001F3B5B18|nr:hypothetical protein [Tychonema sp. BBK16]MCF6371773.1 hypothetical protein [Tychonema sp. BBK16]